MGAAARRLSPSAAMRCNRPARVRAGFRAPKISVPTASLTAGPVRAVRHRSRSTAAAWRRAWAGRHADAVSARRSASRRNRSRSSGDGCRSDQPRRGGQGPPAPPGGGAGPRHPFDAELAQRPARKPQAGLAELTMPGIATSSPMLDTPRPDRCSGRSDLASNARRGSAVRFAGPRAAVRIPRQKVNRPTRAPAVRRPPPSPQSSSSLSWPPRERPPRPRSSSSSSSPR